MSEFVICVLVDSRGQSEDKAQLVLATPRTITETVVFVSCRWKADGKTNAQIWPHSGVETQNYLARFGLYFTKKHMQELTGYGKYRYISAKHLRSVLKLEYNNISSVPLIFLDVPKVQWEWERQHSVAPCRKSKHSMIHFRNKNCKATVQSIWEISPGVPRSILHTNVQIISDWVSFTNGSLVAYFCIKHSMRATI